MKKMAMVLLCVMVLSAMAIGNEANATAAQPSWFNCTCSSIGSLPAPFNFYFIFATSNDALWVGNRVFLVDAAPTNPATKTVLAALLTGYASGGLISLYVPGFGTGAPGTVPPPENTLISGAVAGQL